MTFCERKRQRKALAGTPYGQNAYKRAGADCCAATRSASRVKKKRRRGGRKCGASSISFRYLTGIRHHAPDAEKKKKAKEEQQRLALKGAARRAGSSIFLFSCYADLNIFIAGAIYSAPVFALLSS